MSIDNCPTTIPMLPTVKKIFIKRRSFGLTLIELMIGLLITSILAGLAFSVYSSHIERTRNQIAGKCLLEIQLIIESYHTVHFDYPPEIGDITLSQDCQTDPWGQPYQYLKIAGGKGKGGNRKDRSENPLNSDYDLYSMGRDGKTSQSLRPKVSHDDIIRAKNGGYIGLAGEY